MMPVERYCNQQSYTIGLVFLNDLRILLKLPDFVKYFDQPVSLFIKEMNYYDPEEADDEDSFGH